jgi:fructose-1,6-bisphosphatase II
MELSATPSSYLYFSVLFVWFNLFTVGTKTSLVGAEEKMTVIDMGREVTLEFIRVTEAAALKASRWMGRGDKEAADQAAVDAMRGMLDLVSIRGTIIIGEGEKDKAPMLYIGEKVGGGGLRDPKVDIAVDPIDGTTLTSKGLPNAIAVIAVGNEGTLASFPSYYVNKIAVGPEARGSIDINDSVQANLERVAKASGARTRELTAIVLDRPRHSEIIAQVREAGARIKLISDGDVAGAIAAAMEDSGVNILFGIGGSPEAVLAAAALKCLGGEMQVQIWPRDDEERQKILDMGYSEGDFEKVYETEDLVKGDSIIFCATGITGGDFLPGVRYEGNMAITHSVAMRAKTTTVRYVTAHHDLDIKTIPSRTEAREVEI